MAEPRFEDVPVTRVMTRRPATIEDEAPLEDAAARMAEGGFRHLPVVDEDRRVVGMLSERDLRLRLGTDVVRFSEATPDALAEPVSTAMSPDPITLPPDATLAAALEVFADDRVGAIPIADARDRVVGIVSYVDLLAWLRARAGERPLPGAPPAGRRRARAAPSARAVKRAAPAKKRRRRGGRKGKKQGA